MKNSFKLMFFLTMMMGTMMSISSISWFSAWIGLEINFLSFIPLMIKSNNKYTSEAMIKYFMIQAMASAMFMFSILILNNLKSYKITILSTFTMMMNTALLLKMGAAPFHFWMPEIASGLNWEMIYTLMTGQKIAPMVLLSYSMNIPMFIYISIILSSILSGLQGLNQICMRKIFMYSSINHISWMLAALLCSLNIWILYFLTYCLINLNLVYILNSMNIFFMNQLTKLLSFNKTLKFFFMMNFLSLGGLPPFMGFFPKWLTANFLIYFNHFSLMVALVIFSLLPLYFYMRITFPSLTLNQNESLMIFTKKTSFFFFFINSIMLMGLALSTFMIDFF